MKTIKITGKRNTDKVNNIQKPQRKETLHWNFDEIYFTYNKQIEIINQLYLEQEIELEKIFKREIERKINGYKNQDIQKEIFDLNYFISLDRTIEKLVGSKLKCFYCNDNCELIYKDNFAKKQWTLDRLDNNMGHNDNNVVICCLECNIKRGNMDSERFKKGKDIKIVRKQF
tara:strand:+ start:536 stop:1051 length:516 start_codon:yes stop_codon:yes gene_type:complete